MNLPTVLFEDSVYQMNLPTVSVSEILFCKIHKVLRLRNRFYFVLQNMASLIESSNSTVGRFILYSRDIQVGHIEPFISTKVRLLLYQMELQFSQNTTFCLKKPGRFRIHSIGLYSQYQLALILYYHRRPPLRYPASHVSIVAMVVKVSHAAFQSPPLTVLYPPLPCAADDTPGTGRRTRREEKGRRREV